jgi:hypothetical protein
LAQLEPTVRQTLDWSNQQSHRLYQERVVSGTSLEWRNGMMRNAGAPPANDDRDNDRDVRAIETQWANGLTARTVRIAATPGTTYDGKQVRGDILSTRLMRDGVEVGNASYLTYERIFTWVMPGVSEGVIATEHLKARYGGWPFTPDLIWMNLQTLGTFHWRTLLKAKGTVARVPSTRGTNPLLQFFLPSLTANEPGCDGMHRLDGSVFRPCCDIHDACYYAATPQCTQNSWWYWGSWSCDRCNIMAFACFIGGGIHPPFVQYP